MAANPKDIHEPSYVLRTGAAGATRLHLLHHLFGPISRQMLLEAGIAPGMRVLDLGCGIGTVSCWMASQVGPDGAVVSVDLNADQLAVARTEAEALDVKNTITFLERSASDTGLPSESFDIVFCRFLLCHLVDPLAALKEMHRVLKSGGAIVCQDVDLATTCSLPDSDAVNRSAQVAIEAGKKIGADYRFGRRLHSELLKLGFTSVAPRFDQPVHLSGPEKHFWEYTFSEAAPGIIKAGAINQPEADELCRLLHQVTLDPGTVIAQHGSFSCLAVKP
jgi:ubiquinone/menaquinone biosynthesis C-methylase UbiE